MAGAWCPTFRRTGIKMFIIPDDKVREVRERADIVTVVSDYVALRRAGSNYQGLCPFHGEKTPSFNVSPGRGIFHCFGCGVGGDVYAFIMRIEGASFPEAVKLLARRVGVVIEEQPLSPAEKRRADERELLFSIMEKAARYYRRLLIGEPAGEPGRQYLQKRGVASDTAEVYGLGYASEARDGLVRYLEKGGVALPLAEKLGLIRRGDRGGYYDLFRNRLLFCISDVQGRAIGFGGRVLDNSLPKYINSPESPIYHKSDVLFGLHLAKQTMRESGEAIVVEGYFDHLALYQAGVKNVVAACGTALTGSHAKLLQRYAAKVYTLFDADNAGKKATIRAIDTFLDERLPAFVVELTAGEDPDSFIRKEGSALFAERVKQAQPALDFLLRVLVREIGAGTIEGKVKIVEQLAPRLMKLENQVERDLYLRETSRVLGVPEATLRKRLGGKVLSPVDLAPRRETKKGIAPQEMLLSLMGKYPDVAQRVKEYGIDRLFQPEFTTVAETVAEQALAGEVHWSIVLDIVESPEAKSRLAAMLLDEGRLDDVDPHKAFEQCRLSLERETLKDLKMLSREIAGVEPDSPRYHELLRQMNLLRSKKSQLL